MEHKMYLLAADSARAKIYEVEQPATRLTVVYDQVNFVGRINPAMAANAERYQPALAVGEHTCCAEEEDFAKSLCRVLRAKYKEKKFDSLIVIASGAFLAAILRQLDSDCLAVLLGSIAISPAHLNEREIVRHLQGMTAAAYLS